MIAAFDGIIDMMAPVAAGTYAVARANNINNGLVKDLTKAVIIGAIGFDEGRVIMAHDVSNGALDPFFNVVQTGYSTVLNKVGNLKDVSGSLGSILGSGGYAAYEFFKGFKR